LKLNFELKLQLAIKLGLYTQNRIEMKQYTVQYMICYDLMAG